MQGRTYVRGLIASAVVGGVDLPRRSVRVLVRFVTRGISALRRRAWRAFYRSRLVRDLVAAARWPKLRTELPDLAHLAVMKETKWGPVQRDEALFLHSLVRVLRPETIVEIGFLRGVSAFNFLRALDEDARLYSFDIDPASERAAHEKFGDDERFVFRLRSQDSLTRSDIDGRQAEFIFLDASHDLALNQATFERLLPLMAPRAILAIHDTGTIPRAFLPSGHWWLTDPDGWVGDGHEVSSDEREFVNWLLEHHTDFSQVHLHSRRVFRYGLSLLQRSAPLPRPASPS